jgi:DNA-binding transcriptional MerR regulator
MKIGELADLESIPKATLRYYERRGLLSRPARNASGYRSYAPEVVTQLRLIRWAKSLGFTLREIREMTQVATQHVQGRRSAIRFRVQSKLREIDAKMEQLRSIREQLRAMAECHCRPGRCPVVNRVLAGTIVSPKRGDKRC